MKETSSVKRRLAAILAADAAGYSARMAEDEERTLRTLVGHRRHIDNLIADHGGRLVGTAGDSVLAEFGSSVEAVRCAVEIQEALATRNESLSEPERLHFRIGINLGDVIVDGDDILGDGVNVASRLEGIAEPGGICIASSVFDQISGKLNLGFEDIGARPLKNISRPVRAYRVSQASAPERPHHGSRRTLIAAAGGAAAIIVAALAVFYMGRTADHPSSPAPGPAAAPAPTVAQTTSAQPTTSQPVATSPPATVAPPPRSEPPAQAAAAPAKPPVTRPSAGTDSAAPPRGAATSPPPATQGQTAGANYTMGLAQNRCRRPDGSFGPAGRGRARVVAGEVIIALGQPGEPGHIDLRGRPEADGTLVLDGFIIPTAGRARGTKVAARYEGRLTDGRGMLTGNQGVQRCSLGLQLK
jgi:class 3 adenylate cyclase